MDESTWTFGLLGIMGLGLFLLLVAGVIVGLVFLVKKSKEQARHSEENIARMVNILSPEKRTVFLLQLNNVRKNPTTAVIFALFLGGFGAHHFYLGNPGLGVLYIVFSWTYIPSFIALIEAFTIGGKTAQYNEKKAQEYLQIFST
jgi:TM2 domain-containing membrane protein YozV